MWSCYIPKGPIDHLTSPAAVTRAREGFLSRRPSNLEYLFRKRYEWMNEYIAGKSTVVDLGCGLGMSREFVRSPNLLLTDINQYPWVDQRVDALSPPFPDNSVDVFICGHIVHHLPHPMLFFDKITRMLKPGGRVLIQELEVSLMFKVLLRLMKNEGWDSTINVFDRGRKCTPNPQDPWSANCAIPHLLFSSSEGFESQIDRLKVVRNELCECLIFPLSGGVLAKVSTVNLPQFALRAIDKVDDLAIALSPDMFALGRRVVLEKSQ